MVNVHLIIHMLMVNKVKIQQAIIDVDFVIEEILNVE